MNIITPKKYILNGLWFGSGQPQKLFIFVHGLTANAFSNHDLVVPLVGKGTAAMTFSNRGHDIIATIYPVDKKSKKGCKSIIAGMAHEVFTDCVDDIQGAVNFARSRGVKNIYLVGHSTGCQKIIYYLARAKPQSAIKGAVLLCPLSDYSSAKKFTNPRVLGRATKIARELVKQKRPHELLPGNAWPYIIDAQRFLSLHTPDSKEEMFTYARPNVIPKTLHQIKVPILTVLAEKDEHGDIQPSAMLDWFKGHIRAADASFAVVKDALHNFDGLGYKVVKIISNWAKKR
ncbi:MAG: alpha/beta fold hydrolase [Patescibacteria group bacterium]